MRVFITGVAGFLGSHLAERLLALHHEVVGCDTFVVGKRNHVPKGVRFHEVDCRDFSQVLNISQGCELVYHCAAPGYEDLPAGYEMSMMDAIVSGSVGVFSAAIANRARRIVFCSSTTRYGKGSLLDADPRPQTLHGIAQVSVEKALAQMASTGGVEYTVAVPYNVVGARQRFDNPYSGNFAAVMANMMLQGRAPLVMGCDRQSVAFGHVDDCVRVLVTLGVADRSIGEVVNIGPGKDESVTVGTLLGMLQGIAEFEGSAVYLPEHGQRVPVVYDNTKAKALGYGARRPLGDALRDVVAYVRTVGPRPCRYDMELLLRTPEQV